MSVDRVDSQDKWPRDVGASGAVASTDMDGSDMSDATSESRSESQVAVDVALDRVAMTAMAWIEGFRQRDVRIARTSGTGAFDEEYGALLHAVVVAQDALEASKPVDPVAAALDAMRALLGNDSEANYDRLVLAMEAVDGREPEPVPGADGSWVTSATRGRQWAIDSDGDLLIRDHGDIAAAVYKDDLAAIVAALDARETGAGQ